MSSYATLLFCEAPEMYCCPVKRRLTLCHHESGWIMTEFILFGGKLKL